MERRGGKENTEVNNGPTPVVLVLFVSVMYSTDTDIKSGVKRWYDVDVTVYRSFSRLLEMERGNGKQDVQDSRCQRGRPVYQIW